MPLPVQPTTSPTPSDAPSEQPGFLSPAFITAVGVIATNSVILLGILYKLSPEDVATIQNAVAAIVTSGGVMGGSFAVAWKFIEHLRSLKTTSIVAETSLQNVKALIAASPDANSPGQDSAILASIQTMNQRK